MKNWIEHQKSKSEYEQKRFDPKYDQTFTKYEVGAKNTQTLINQNDDFMIIKIDDQFGNSAGMGYYEAHCKHCNYVQHGNPQYDIIAHLKSAHQINED